MEIDIKAETLLNIFNFPLTNTLLTEWLAIFLIFLLGFYLRKKITLIPQKRIQNILEILVEGAKNLIETIFEKDGLQRSVFIISLSIFVFILIPNWLGVFPGIGSIGFYEKEKFVPFFRSPNSDLNMTLAMALFSVFLAQYYGIRKLGFFHYLKRFINFKGPFDFFVGLLEIISEFAKIISFSFRLFCNIFAGEVLLIIVSILIPLIAPLPFIFLEFFVGSIQALIFAMLTAIFIKVAISH